MTEDSYTRQRDDHSFMAAARAELERSTREMDVLTVARLRAMRQRALVETQPRPLRLFSMQPASGIAVAVLLLLGLLLLGQRMGAGLPEADAYELLATSHGHDATDTAEFYEWLDAQYKTGDAPELDAI